MGENGVKFEDLVGGGFGFSGSYDVIIVVVWSGVYEVGVLNEQVWCSNVVDGCVDLGKVLVIWRILFYVDYYWVVRFGLDECFGDGFIDQFQIVLLDFLVDIENGVMIFEFFGVECFIFVKDEDYVMIEMVGC